MSDFSILFAGVTVSILVGTFAWITVTEFRRMNRRQRQQMAAVREAAVRDAA